MLDLSASERRYDEIQKGGGVTSRATGAPPETEQPAVNSGPQETRNKYV